MLTKGFPRTNSKLKLGKSIRCEHLELFLLEMLNEENLCHWYSISSSSLLPTTARYILCFSLQSSHTLPAEAWRGWKKKIDLSLCHRGPALPEQVIAADLASVCLVQTKAYLFSSPHLWCFLPVLIKYGSSRLVLYNLCATFFLKIYIDSSHTGKLHWYGCLRKHVFLSYDI